MKAYRQFLGDLAFAVLLAVPTLSLSRPQPPPVTPVTQPHASAMIEQVALTQSAAERRFSLAG
jgi:hypothetical protein